MAVTKVISGGQIGADLAGLRAAKALGLKTGGYAPKGFRTKIGDVPALGTTFGIVELASRQYPPRTRRNVAESDGTVRFAHNFYSAGERCTLKAIYEFSKPYFDVPVERQWGISPTRRTEFVHWLSNNKISCLNVAGNSDSWLETFVEQFLVHTLARNIDA